MLLRHPFLIDLVAVDAVREPLQMGRPVPQCRQHRAGRDGPVVVDERTLGALRTERGEEHLVPVGDSDSDAVDVDLLGCRDHTSTVRDPR